jgi:hypothetical protein
LSNETAHEVPRPETLARSVAQSDTNPAGTRILALLLDGISGFILVIVAGLLGEMWAEKPTLDVWREAATAPKFPPIELLLWLAPLVLFGLLFWLLHSRGKTLGAWFRRRGEV